jgi:hypothetical protein
MKINNLLRCCAALAATLTIAACTTLQTTYFNVGYVELAKADDPGLIPYSGEPRFEEVDDMESGSLAMYNKGYAMLGFPSSSVHC